MRHKLLSLTLIVTLFGSLLNIGNVGAQVMTDPSHMQNVGGNILADATPSGGTATLTNAAPSVSTAAGSCFTAVLNGANEAPTPNTTTGTAQGNFVVSPNGAQLTYYIEYSGLTGAATGAHIHKGAVGVAGNIVFPLTTTNPISGVLALTAGNLADLQAGLLYANIHTTMNSAGEIRGQIVANTNCFTANLNGANETPPNNSTATGTGIFSLSPNGDKLTFHVEFSGLGSAETAAHIHKGAVGVSAPPLFTLPAGNPKDGTVFYTSQQNTLDVIAGLYYINIHSTNFGLGEIRGQLLPASVSISAGCFSAVLNGANETPPNATTGVGQANFVLWGNGTYLTYYIEYSGLTGAATGAHIHKEMVGVAGPIVFPLTTVSPISGTLALTAGNLADLRAGLLYANIHTTMNSAGEIRGQIVANANCFTANLNGASETPPNASTATGTGIFSLSPNGDKLTFHAEFSGLSSAETAAHIHKGAVGVMGGIVFPLATGNPKDGTVFYTSQQNTLDAIAGLYYINIHSSNFGLGEIRGQLFLFTVKIFLPIVVR